MMYQAQKRFLQNAALSRKVVEMPSRGLFMTQANTGSSSSLFTANNQQ